MQSAINLSCKLLESTGGNKFDVQLNVVRPSVYLRHDLSPPDDAVVIAFTSTPPLSLSRNLRITPDITSPFSSIPVGGLESIISNISFSVPSKEFFLTDVFVVDSTGKRTPLYYRHSLPLDAAPHSPVNIYDQDLNIVTNIPQLYWRTDIENSLYSNLQSSYNQETGEYAIYYIGYVDSAGNRKLVLLDNEPIFKELTVENYLDFSTQKRYYSVHKNENYLIVTCLFNYKAYSPTPLGLAYLIPQEAFGELLPPEQLDITNPWILKVSNFDLYEQGLDGIVRRYWIPEFDDQNFSPYNPYKQADLSPAFVLTTSVVKSIHKNLKIDTAGGFNLDMIVFRSDGTLRYAFTTDVSKDLYYDTFGNITSNHYRTDGFSSIDPVNGFIKLNHKIDIADQVFLNYYFTDNDYDYTKIDLNPRLNSSINNQEAVVFMVPEKSFSYTVNVFSNEINDNQVAIMDMATKCFPSFSVRPLYNTLSQDFWETAQVLVIDAPSSLIPFDKVQTALNGGHVVITNPSQYTSLKTYLGVSDTGSFTAEEMTINYVHYNAGYLIAGCPGIPDGIGAYWLSVPPKGWFKDDWFAGYGWFGKGPRGYLEAIMNDVAEAAIGSFIPTAITRGLYHLLVDNFGTITYCNYPGYNLVGSSYNVFLNGYSMANINCNQCMIVGHAKVLGGGALITEIEISDCRQPGGGFKDGLSYEYLMKNCPEATWCFDEGWFDGRIFPGGSSLLIELPFKILKTYGGRFTPDEILTKVKKNLAVGTYPVIRYYGPRDPRVLSYSAGNGQIHLTWEYTGGCPYTVYWGLNPDSLTNSAIVNGDSYTITGLKNGLSYTVLVTPIIDNSCVLDQEYLNFSVIEMGS